MYYNNLTLLLDLYQLTMMEGYYLTNKHKDIAVFELFYRKNPDENGYAIFAGLEQIIDYIKNIKFTEDDINYLNTLGKFDKKFLNFLLNIKFTGDIYSVKEGTVVFPKEPLIKIKAPIIEAQLIETMLLNIVNHQSLIATKASRICWAANKDKVIELGLRRAHGPDAGIYGSRASIIGGCVGTSNVLCGKIFKVPVVGTMAHSWVMSFLKEIDSFRKYAKLFPNNCILLIDTYDTLNSGIINAITVFKEMKKEGIKLKNYGVRIDSGDISYLSKEIRKMLDKEGFLDANIVASNNLDEDIISYLKLQNTKVSTWGVGTNLITSKSCPTFGAVYKLVALYDKNNNCIPKIKISENIEKITIPGEKQIFRIYSKKTGKIKGDLITLINEKINEKNDITIFDQEATWKKMTLKGESYTVKKLLQPIFIKGKCIYKSPNILEIRKYCKENLNTLWEEYRRLKNPHIMPVDLSLKLYKLKMSMIKRKI